MHINTDNFIVYPDLLEMIPSNANQQYVADRANRAYRELLNKPPHEVARVAEAAAIKMSGTLIEKTQSTSTNQEAFSYYQYAVIKIFMENRPIPDHLGPRKYNALQSPGPVTKDGINSCTIIGSLTHKSRFTLDFKRYIEEYKIENKLR
jgi:hypothetical protein